MWRSFNIRKVTADPPEAAKSIGWERPILYVKIGIGGPLPLHVLVVHLKSRIPTDIAGQKIDTYIWRTSPGWAEGYFVSSLKRVGQALETRIVLDKIFDQAESAHKDPFIVVAGDFNSDFDEVTVSAILGKVEDTCNPALGKRMMVPCELTVPEPSRFSLLHMGKGVMYDHVLASRALVAYYRGAEIENELLPDESIAFHTNVLYPESDHAPVIAAFEMP